MRFIYVLLAFGSLLAGFLLFGQVGAGIHPAVGGMFLIAGFGGFVYFTLRYRREKRIAKAEAIAEGFARYARKQGILQDGEASTQASAQTDAGPPRPITDDGSKFEFEPTSSVGPSSAAMGKIDHFGKCFVIWSVAFVIYSIVLFVGSFWLALGAFAAVWLVAIMCFLRPIRSLGIGKVLGIIAVAVNLVLGTPIVLANYGSYSKQRELAALRETNPSTYLEQIKTTASAEEYEREFRAVDPKGYLAELAKSGNRTKYLEELRTLDPASYETEKERIASEEAVQRAKEEAERVRAEIAEQKRLAGLRKADPSAYLDAIKGESNWVSEFKQLDPKGYEKWRSETASKKIAEYAYAPYEKAGYPKTFAKWGPSAVKKINALRKEAAFLVALDPKCNMVEVSELSDERSTPKDKIVIFVDCRNNQRFYLTEEQIKAGADPVSKNETTALISDERAIEACESQIRAALQYPSSYSRSLLGVSVFRSNYGNIAVTIEFDAKNGLGMEVPQIARCVVDDRGIHPAEIGNR